jgi:hypothetical protein
MKVIQVQSWEQYVAEIEKIQSVRDTNAQKHVGSVSDLLYRGHPDARHGLTTTLERKVPGNVSLRRYYDFVEVIKAKIQSITGNRWDTPSRQDYEQWTKTIKTMFNMVGFPGADYFAYLRHHGFPSPLLDWTRSPFIAAHFAMVDTPSDTTTHVAVYVFLEYAGGVKSGELFGPEIRGLGRFIETHKRHYLQQSTYTVCVELEDGIITYVPHEKVVAMASPGQDLVWKLVIPVTERTRFLAHLERMNINSFSLFETEDRLMEHIYISEVLLGGNL